MACRSRTRTEIRRRLDELGAGAEVTYTLEQPGGSSREHRGQVLALTEDDWRAIFLPYTLGGVLALLTGLVPALARPDLLAARVFFLMNVGFATNLGFLGSDYFLVHRFPPWSLAAGLLASGSLMLFGLVFPGRLGPARRHLRATVLAVYGLHAVFWVAFGIALARAPDLLRVLDFVELALFELGGAIFLLNVGLSAWRAPQPVERRQARFLLASLALTLPGGFLFDAALFGWFDAYVPNVVYQLPAWVFAILLVYSMVAHNVFELDLVVRRGLSAALIALGAVALQLVVLLVVAPWEQGSPPGPWPARSRSSWSRS